MSSAQETPDPLAAFTPRERELLDLLAQGLTKKQIHVRLGISIYTVDSHIRTIKHKAGISGQLHRLVAWYLMRTMRQDAA